MKLYHDAVLDSFLLVDRDASGPIVVNGYWRPVFNQNGDIIGHKSNNQVINQCIKYSFVMDVPLTCLTSDWASTMTKCFRYMRRRKEHGLLPAFNKDAR